MNLDGSHHALAKKGGKSGAYQRRKKAKTSNICLFDGQGYVLACPVITAGNHNDSFSLKFHLQPAFKDLKQLGLPIAGTYFNADAAFDTHEARRPASITT